MKTFADHMTEDRRLVLLKALQSASQYKANAYLLRRFADAVAHTVSADRIETDIAWLHEQGLVARSVAEGVTIATLTMRGLDVAEGRTLHPGVQQPQPGS